MVQVRVLCPFIYKFFHTSNLSLHFSGTQFLLVFSTPLMVMLTMEALDEQHNNLQMAKSIVIVKHF